MTEKETLMTFGNNNLFTSCGEGMCRFFKSVADVKEAYENGEIGEVRIMSKGKAKDKVDVVADLSKGIFGKNEFGQFVLKVPNSALKQHKEEASNIMPKDKKAVA